MAYRVDIIIVDESVPVVGGDRPEVIREQTISVSPYNKLDLAEKLAKRVAEWGMTMEPSITGKRQ